MTPPPASSLPIVLLPIGTDDDALDACLGALDAGTPAGTRLWLADDAQAGPRALAIIERWLTRTSLQADYTRRPRMLGEVAHMDQMLAACGDVDVVVLSPDAQPLPGWLQQLAACLARDAAIATATPWCNAGETAAWPRLGEVSPPPDDVERTAQACAAMPPLHPELPAAVAHAVALRGSARKRVGGLDSASYASWYAALVDLSSAVRPGLAQRAVRDRVRRARRRGWASRWRHGCLERALADLHAAVGDLPDGRPAARTARASRRPVCRHRIAGAPA